MQTFDDTIANKIFEFNKQYIDICNEPDKEKRNIPFPHRAEGLKLDICSFCTGLLDLNIDDHLFQTLVQETINILTQYDYKEIVAQFDSDNYGKPYYEAAMEALCHDADEHMNRAINLLQSIYTCFIKPHSRYKNDFYTYLYPDKPKEDIILLAPHSCPGTPMFPWWSDEDDNKKEEEA